MNYRNTVVEDNTLHTERKNSDFPPKRSRNYQCIAFLLLLCGSVFLFLFVVWNMIMVLQDTSRSKSSLSLRTNHYVNRFHDVISETVGEVLGKEVLAQELVQHNGLPEIKLKVDVKTERNPFIKDLDARYHLGTAMNVKFRSLYPKRVNIWWENHAGGLDQGHLILGQETTTNTYVGHEFFFTEHGNKENEIARFRMSADKVAYTVEDPKEPPPSDLKLQSDKEHAFMDEYFARTGIHWRHFYGPEGPRPPPILYMHPAERVGDVHATSSSHGYWVCEGEKEDCQTSAPVDMQLEVVSLLPRVFVIDHFLSDFEVEEIIKLAAPAVHQSVVGDPSTGVLTSSSRTSSNAWIKRERTPVIHSIYSRAADLLHLDEPNLVKRRAVEDMQVVHYLHGQKYDSHHDWGVSGHPESRYITLLLYLTVMVSPQAGGETAFPKADDGKGFKIHPGKMNFDALIPFQPGNNCNHCTDRYL
jgi:hypothetical protein